MEQATYEELSIGGKPEIEGLFAKIRKEFEGRSEELIPMLQSAQRALGYLPEEVLLGIAHLTKLPAARVFGVVTFYEQFRLQPVGKHVIRVCQGTACYVRGSDRILKDIQTRFNVAPGETTQDKLFTLDTVACFGSCALAPVMVVDGSVKGGIDPPKARKILEQIRKENRDSLKEKQ